MKGLGFNGSRSSGVLSASLFALPGVLRGDLWKPQLSDWDSKTSESTLLGTILLLLSTAARYAPLWIPSTRALQRAMQALSELMKVKGMAASAVTASA